MPGIFEALSSSVRREIIFMLKEKDMSAGEIAEHLEISKSTLSGHFNVLKSAGLVVTDRSGTTIIYSLSTSVVEEMIGDLMNMFFKEKDIKNKNVGDEK
jgi:ArsR family transcriptional regulator, arsenate/arsenite/antimonite-responsive transcriptional repressor